MSELQREGFEDAQQTFEFLQQCCEGHNRKLQDLLRAQPMHQSSEYLVQQAADMFSMQVISYDTMLTSFRQEIVMMNIPYLPAKSTNLLS